MSDFNEEHTAAVHYGVHENNAYGRPILLNIQGLSKKKGTFLKKVLLYFNSVRKQITSA
jgi:hypothetical protein